MTQTTVEQGQSQVAELVKRFSRNAAAVQVNRQPLGGSQPKSQEVSMETEWDLSAPIRREIMGSRRKLICSEIPFVRWAMFGMKSRCFDQAQVSTN